MLISVIVGVLRRVKKVLRTENATRGVYYSMGSRRH